MNRDLAQTVRERAGNRCEYCRIPQSALQFRFQIDHIIAEQHGGETALANLAFACPHCNRYKGPNIAGLDPQSGQLVRLFHPCIDEWVEHFQLVGAHFIGKTLAGRATVQVLAMNADEMVRFRMALLQAGETVETLNGVVDAELEELPEDMRARFVYISQLIGEFGLERVREPHVTHLRGPLWEMRMKGRDGTGFPGLST